MKVESEQGRARNDLDTDQIIEMDIQYDDTRTQEVEEGSTDGKAHSVPDFPREHVNSSFV